MTRFAVILLLAGAIFIAGCSLTESMEVKNRRLGILMGLDMRMVVDDFEAIWLLDRVGRLTEFHPRSGK